MTGPLTRPLVLPLTSPFINPLIPVHVPVNAEIASLFFVTGDQGGGSVYLAFTLTADVGGGFTVLNNGSFTIQFYKGDDETVSSQYIDDILASGSRLYIYASVSDRATGIHIEGTAYLPNGDTINAIGTFPLEY